METGMSGKPSSSTTTFVITHVIAVGLGCGIWSMVRGNPDGKESGKPGAEESSWKSQERRSERRERIKREGDELLTEMTKVPAMEGSGPWSEDQMADYRERQRQRYIQLNQKADELAPAANLSEAAVSLMKQCLDKNSEGLTAELQMEMQSRLLHWMRADPQGMIAFMTSSEDPTMKQFGMGYLRMSAEATMERIGPAEAAKWLGTNQQFDNQFHYMIGAKLGEKANLAELESVRGVLNPKTWPNLRNAALASWPLSKADEVMKIAADENNPGILSYYASQKEGGGKWLMDLLASDRIDQEAKDAIMKRPDYRSILRYGSDIDFDTRVDAISSFEKDKTPEQVKLELGALDVTKALSAGRDWRYAFRSGALTAEEVYQGLAQQLPELASKSPEALRNQLYKELAEDNGTAALKLLDGVPADQKWETAMKSPRFMFNDVDPQVFYDYLQQIPAEPSEEVWTMRLGAWADRSRRNHERLGNDYVQWVEALPQGVDREMAFYNLLKTTGKGDTELNTRLRSEIKDPRLLERLANMNK